VQLGLITDAAGPWCGKECDNLLDINGTAYRAYHELAYGYYSRACPPDSTAELDCQHWIFLDVKTGKLITGALPRLRAAVPDPSPPDGAAG
jgi:hypothetical protein